MIKVAPRVVIPSPHSPATTPRSTCDTESRIHKMEPCYSASGSLPRPNGATAPKEDLAVPEQEDTRLMRHSCETDEG